MTDYERDYPDHTQTPGWEHGDEPPCNTSANPTFYDLVDQASPAGAAFSPGVWPRPWPVSGAWA